MANKKNILKITRSKVITASIIPIATSECSHLQLLDELDPLLGGEGLGALNGRANSAVNDELGKDTNGAGDTEEDGVVVGLGEAVVLEQDTGVGVDVGEGVLGLAVLGEDAGGNLVDLADELVHGVVGHVGLGKGTLGHVAGVGLAEDGVAVAGNDTAGLEGVPEVLGDVGIGHVVTNDLLHLGEPVEDLLVGETVEGAGETVETGGEGEEGRAEGRADKVGGVGRDVATLVVGVDGEVETHQLNKVGVVAEAELVGEVEGVILVLLDGSDLAALEDVLVDARSNVGELGDEVHRVLVGVGPVLLLVDTLGVGLGELGGLLESSDGKGELGHGVEVGRAVIDELLDELGDVGAGSPLGGEVTDLLLGRDLTGQEEPEETCGRVSRLAGTSQLGRGWRFLPSGRGSLPPGALGRSSWHSGIVLPRKRIPSSESRTEPSQTRDLIPRAPP